MFDALDANHDEYIDEEEYMNLVMLKTFTAPKHKHKSSALVTFFRSPTFTRIICLTNLIHTVATYIRIALIASGDVDLNHDALDMNTFTGIFSGIMTFLLLLEQLVKLYAFGPTGYIYEDTPWFRERAIVVFASFLWILAAPKKGHVFVLVQAAYTIFIFQTLQQVVSFDVVLRSLLALLPALSRLGAVVLCLMFTWSVLGVALMGGEINLNNTQLNDAVANSTDSGYYSMNFNTVPTAMYTLVMTLAGNNIPQFTNTYWTVGGAVGAIYYVLFYAFGTWVILNVFVSFFLDAYDFVQESSPTKQELREKRKAAVLPSHHNEEGKVTIKKHESLEEQIYES